MKADVVKRTLPVSELRPGDEMWLDKPYHHHSKEPEDESIGFMFTVVGNPISSVNTSLFPGEGNCIVVACEYMDGSRGSRLYNPSTKITIRRRVKSLPKSEGAEADE